MDDGAIPEKSITELGDAATCNTFPNTVYIISSSIPWTDLSASTYKSGISPLTTSK